MKGKSPFYSVRGGAMKTISTIRSIAASIIFLIVVCPIAWGSTPPAVGGVLPDFTLTAPKDGAERDYLGLSFFNRSFRIPDLKAQVVIIEIFSMYCPYCQAEAPNVNQLYDKIQADPALKSKVKVIGIGVGNSSFEVNIFKNKYHILFPLFTDGDFKIHKLMGEVRTPYFIVIRLKGNGSHQVIFSRLGTMGQVDQFLADVITRLGFK
jgi:peroxiredoxin